VIFFIVSKTRRKSKTWKALKDGSAGGPLSYTQGGGYVIIAWNEVFPSLAELKAGVFAVARTDPVCRDIRAQAIARFGIDPLLEQCTGGNVDQETMRKLVDTTFLYWAHPCIGNITLSKRHALRPSPIGSEPLLNWSSCGLLDPTTKQAVNALQDMLGPIDRSRRDQVRICTSVTELARAIIGEISCEATRRLEKLFALRLCRSPRLLKQQQDLLVAMFTAQKSWLDDLPASFEWGACEYTKYYLGTPQRRDWWPLFATLLDDATGGKFLTTKFNLSNSAQASFNTWQMLPNTIRCAVLMNDLRKVAKHADQPARRTSMCMLEDNLPLGGGKDPVYTVGISAGKVLESAFLKDSQWVLAWSWNRDEYGMATMTYRHFLCPLWAGASGHTNGALMFWAAAIKKPLGEAQQATVVTGLFTLWRLYYDKRFGANHTLAETFEASGGPFLDKNLQLTIPDKPQIPKIAPDADAFSLIESCWKMRGGFGDPVLILHACGESYLRPGASFAEQFAALKTDIDKERRELSVQFTVPVWSWTLEPKQGLATISFAEKFPSPSPLTTITLVPNSSHTINLALTILTNKDADETKKDGD
jgi:hypothetical protein